MPDTRDPAAPAPRPSYTILKWGREWKLLDPAGELVCITVYKKGAEEVVRRLTA